MGTQQAATAAVVRRAGEGPKRWFFGGGVMTWKVGSEDGAGDLLVIEDELAGGKVTPVHTHPIAESLSVLEGALRYRVESDDVDLSAGDFIMVPAGIPHAFKVLSDSARVFSIQPSCECEAFYLGASEPLEGSSCQTDFERIARSGETNGGITILGPPPF